MRSMKLLKALTTLDDAALHGALKHTVGKANTLTAQLAELEARYHVQFSADQAYIDLLEEARDLLQHEVPDRNLVEAQRRALQLLVEHLRRRKYAATAQPRESVRQVQERPQAQATHSGPATQGRHLPAALRRVVPRWRALRVCRRTRRALSRDVRARVPSLAAVRPRRSRYGGECSVAVPGPQRAGLGSGLWCRAHPSAAAWRR